MPSADLTAATTAEDAPGSLQAQPDFPQERGQGAGSDRDAARDATASAPATTRLFRRRTLEADQAPSRTWATLIVPIVVVIVWEALARGGWIPTRILPAPSHVAEVAWTLTRSGELPHHLWVSLKRSLISLTIGGSLGLVLGLATGLSRWAELLLDGMIQSIRTIPTLALVPLAILWFGIGEESKLFLMVIGVFFPLYITAYLGIRGIDPKLVDVARIYGLDRRGLVLHVLLPGALPSLLVGLRMSLGFMWINLIVAESFATEEGIGYLVNNAREFLQTDIIVLGILLYGFLGKAADSVTRVLERWFLGWHTRFGGL
jgi:sulfonate transport system permease protein